MEDRSSSTRRDSGVGPLTRPAGMTGQQIRAARKLLNWTPDRLAKRARLAVGIVLQAEREESNGLVPPAASRSIQQALQEAGIEAVEPVGHVRLRS